MRVEQDGTYPAYVVAMVERVAADLGLACRIRLEALSPLYSLLYGVQGQMEPRLRGYVVRLNLGTMIRNPYSLLRTVAHELRHVYQQESNMEERLIIEAMEQTRVMARWHGGDWWLHNDPRWDDYVNQPWEVDARKWSELYTADMP